MQGCLRSVLTEACTFGQPNFVSNNSYPAQYWSGESQNGTGMNFFLFVQPLTIKNLSTSYYGRTYPSVTIYQ